MNVLFPSFFNGLVSDESVCLSVRLKDSQRPQSLLPWVLDGTSHFLRLNLSLKFNEEQLGLETRSLILIADFQTGG